MVMQESLLRYLTLVPPGVKHRVPAEVMADEDESLVRRRPKRSTAGNRYVPFNFLSFC